jgi:hypothetical protein
MIMIDLQCSYLKYDQFDRAYCSLFRKEFGACEKCPKNTTLIRFSLGKFIESLKKEGGGR